MRSMSTTDTALGAVAEPADVGLDAERLTRIDRHFERYVQDGRLPGFLVVVSRAGRIAPVARAGPRDIDAGAPVEPDTLWRIYSMTKPVTSVAAMMLWEEGRFELKDPVAKFIPSFADARVYARRSARVRARVGAEAAARSAGGAGAHVAPAHARLGADVRLPPRARRRRD